MITGDHAATATAIAKQIGIIDESQPIDGLVMRGEELDVYHASDNVAAPVITVAFVFCCCFYVVVCVLCFAMLVVFLLSAVCPLLFVCCLLFLSVVCYHIIVYYKKVYRRRPLLAQPIPNSVCESKSRQQT